ncbi:MAG TPA: hypothetical protein VLK84_28730 [Longimicrobium sp.]|nr:hypothetical protein [Longimicrobium sp.]
MARETAVSTESRHRADPPPPARRRAPRGRWLRAGLGVAAFGALLAAGTCALPKAGLPPGGFVRGGSEAEGVAATRYRAGPLRRGLLGDGHRDAWAAPIRVPVLALDTFAGGLTPERPGGGNQTRSLHLRGADGRDYVFRSTDKDQGGRLGPFAHATFGRVRQDQVGALHPAAAVVADGLLDATALPHADPRLVAMPDDPRLGRFRADFAGRLGIIEQNPQDGFGGAGTVVDTEELLARLRARPAEPVDARMFLSARLMDVYLGDWDRHEGQWKWGRMEGAGGPRWVPIPRDRDYALADYGGLLPSLARRRDAKIVRFDDEIRDVGGLMVEARPLDARFLCPLPATAWDSAAASLRTALTDSAIAASVRRMPAPYVRLGGEQMIATLRARRDRLPAVARDFRRRLRESGACGGSAAGR